MTAPVSSSEAGVANKRVLRGSVLSYGSFLGSKLLWYVSTLVLARLLAPADFGLVAYALLVISYLDIVKDLGITSALIYRQDIVEQDADEAFTLNLLTGLLFFGLCWLLAPLAAHIFHDPRVTGLTRVLGLSFVFAGIGGVHSAIFQKRMSFGRGFLPDFVQALVKGMVSVGLALGGWGYWSLAWGQLCGIAVGTSLTLFLLPWWPRPRLRWASARQLLGYGMHITVVNLLAAAIDSGDYAIIGTTLGSAALGLYTLGYTVSQMLTISIATALSKVIFPAYAEARDDRAVLRRGYLAALRYSALAIVPLGAGLGATAPAFIHALYTTRWWPAIPVLQALSLYAVVYAVGWNAGDVYKAIGRPDIIWKLGIGHALLLLPLLYLGARLGGIVGVGIAQAGVVVPYSLVRFRIVQRVLAIDAASIVAALRVPALAGLTLCASCSLVALAARGTAPLLVLTMQAVTGAVAYGGAVLLFDRELRCIVQRAAGSRLASQPETHLAGAPAPPRPTIPGH